MNTKRLFSLLTPLTFLGCTHTSHDRTTLIPPPLPLPHEYMVGHVRLDTERYFGASENDKKHLDTTLSMIDPLIPVKKTYSPQEATNILTSIGSVITNRFLCESNYFFFQGFRTNAIDCDGMSTLFMSAADRHELPVNAVLIPFHMFVRWRFSDTKYLNWETTANVPFNDEDYTNLVVTTAHERGITNQLMFMNEMSKTEFVAWCADASSDQIRFYSSHSGKMDQEWMSHAYIPAIRYIDYQLKKDPENKELRILQGDLYWRGVNDSNKAIEEYTRVLQQDPNNMEARQKRNNIMKWESEYEPLGFINQFPTSTNE